MATPATTILVHFRNHVVPNEAESKAAGRPVYKDVEVCDIVFAANSKTKACFPAHEAEPNATRESILRGGQPVTYAMLYKDQYQAFKNGEVQTMGGTPLNELPFLTEAKRRELRALNIHNAEALSQLDGQPLKRLGMGGRELKNQAQAYLDRAAGSADVTALAASVASLQEQLNEERALRKEMMDAAIVQKVGPAPVEPPSLNDRHQMQDQPDTDYDRWSDESLKEHIKSVTGQRPMGNPKHETLVNAVRELGQ